MALFYTTKLSGLVAGIPWAVHLHWRLTGPITSNDEADKCHALADMMADFWDDFVKDSVTSRTHLTKVLVQAFGEPTGFYELGLDIGGTLGGDICPPFVSKGFRQYRTNSDFRTSTHRFPEVKEANNVDGSFVYGDGVTTEKMLGISTFITINQEIAESGVSFAGIAHPILIRTQSTTIVPPDTKEVTYYNPPQISDVGGGQFYGITSQVSRKYIIPR